MDKLNKAIAKIYDTLSSEERRYLSRFDLDKPLEELTPDELNDLLDYIGTKNSFRVDSASVHGKADEDIEDEERSKEDDDYFDYPFEEVDEEPLPGESLSHQAKRLSEEAKPKEMPNNKDESSYKFYKNDKKKESDVPFANVIGHDNQKKEILNVVEWFKKAKELKAKGLSIPKGVVLYGAPGNGKSLLIKEIINLVNVPVFVFNGEKTNIVGGIIETFNKAREIGQSIVVFDELDLLINKDARVIRALQENLDGVESNDEILVLSASNNIDDIPPALTRNGRLEKLILIPYPNAKESVTLVKKYFNDLKAKLPEDLDEEELGLSLNRTSCSSIKAIVNDVILRNGFNNITYEMLNNSIFNIKNKVKSTETIPNREIAIHEAGHAVMAYNYPNFFKISKLNINNFGGEFYSGEVEEDFWPYDKVIANVKILLAGNLAQKIICGRGTYGCEDDLSRARSEIYRLVNRNGYKKCWRTLPDYHSYRKESQIKKRSNERVIERIFKKCERETKSYIKKNALKIEVLGNLLYEKTKLTSSQINAVLAQ